MEASTAKSINKIETIQKRAMCFMLNDYESSHWDLFLQKGVPDNKWP